MLRERLMPAACSRKPVMNTRLFVKNFSLNQGRLGDLDIYGAWDNEKQRYPVWMLPFRIYLRLRRVSSGMIYPLKPESGLDLNIDAHELNSEVPRTLYEVYCTVILKGRGTGKVHFYGKFKGLNLDGAVMTDASMKFDILNTHFAVRDTYSFGSYRIEIQ